MARFSLSAYDQYEKGDISGDKVKPSASSPQLDSVVILHRAKPFWQLCVPKIEMATVFAGHIRDVHT